MQIKLMFYKETTTIDNNLISISVSQTALSSFIVSFRPISTKSEGNVTIQGIDVTQCTAQISPL